MSGTKMLYFAEYIFADDYIFPKFAELVIADVEDLVIFQMSNEELNGLGPTRILYIFVPLRHLKKYKFL